MKLQIITNKFNVEEEVAEKIAKRLSADQKALLILEHIAQQNVQLDTGEKPSQSKALKKGRAKAAKVKSKNKTYKQIIVEALATNKRKWFTLDELCKLTNLSKRTVSDNCWHLQNKGVISKDGVHYQF